jgi:hypothetical protein
MNCELLLYVIWQYFTPIAREANIPQSVNEADIIKLYCIVTSAMHLLSYVFCSVIFLQVKTAITEEEAGVGGGCGGRDRISQ